MPDVNVIRHGSVGFRSAGGGAGSAGSSHGAQTVGPSQPALALHHCEVGQLPLLPEVTVNLGYQATEQVRAFIGYNFFWINSVARAGDQVDVVDNRAVRILSSYDPTVVTARPYDLFQTEHSWAHGLNLGLEFRY